jgi:hypothetical protein
MIWTTLGVSVAIVAIFCISVAEALVGKSAFEQHREYVAGALAIAGVAAWFIGRHFDEKRRAAHRDSQPRRFVLFDLKYWGPMLLVLGVITLFIRPLRKANVEVVQAPPKPAPKLVVKAEKPKEPEPPKPKAPVVFPALKMQGVFFRERRPFAIINGESYAVGDRLGDVTIKAIGRTTVTLELSGEQKLLTLN